jgi:hypothetical protein
MHENKANVKQLMEDFIKTEKVISICHKSELYYQPESGWVQACQGTSPKMFYLTK